MTLEMILRYTLNYCKSCLLSKDITKAEKKRSFLLTSLSTRVYKLLRNLTSPKTPTEVDYPDLLKLLKNQFVDKAVLYKERRAFYEAIQESGEDSRTYYNKIKSLSVNCEFGDNLNSILRDRFICGLQRGVIFDRICEEGDNVSIERCLEIARNKEIVTENVSCNKIVQRSKINQSKKANSVNSAAKCNACGKSNHDFKKCKYRKYTCRKCKSKGHLEVACQKRENKQNYIAECTEDNVLDESFSLFTIWVDKNVSSSSKSSQFQQKRGKPGHVYEGRQLQRVSDVTTNEHVIIDQKSERWNYVENAVPNVIIAEAVKEGKKRQLISNLAFDKNNINFCNFFSNTSPYAAVLDVEGVHINFQIDTGSAVSIIPENVYLKNFVKFKISDFMSTLRAYNGIEIDVVGTINVKVTLNDISKSVQLVVIKSNSPPLVGRDLLKIFKFKMLFGEANLY